MTQLRSERELTRKKYIASLEKRSQEQVIEEEALYIEVKKLEQNERRFKREREDLLRLLAGIDSGLLDITEDDVSSLGQLPVADNKKKKKGALESESPATPSISNLNVPVLKRPQPAKNAAYGRFILSPRIDIFKRIPQTHNTVLFEQSYLTLHLLQKQPINRHTFVLSSFQYQKLLLRPRSHRR